jgi:uncharacterized spore protein YtfJ
MSKTSGVGVGTGSGTGQGNGEGDGEGYGPLDGHGDYRGAGESINYPTAMLDIVSYEHRKLFPFTNEGLLLADRFVNAGSTQELEAMFGILELGKDSHG